MLQMLGTIAYPWGYPPPWELPALRAYMMADLNRPNNVAVQERAWNYVAGHEREADGLDQVEALSAMLERRGIRPVLAEMPAQTDLLLTIAQLHGGYQGAYEAALSRYLQASHRQVIPAPPLAKDELYYDKDHLSPQGARLMAAWIERHLRASATAPVVGEARP
jgi:hypothetical protein